MQDRRIARVRTFAMRGRLSDTNAGAVATHWAAYGVDVAHAPTAPLDFVALFGRIAPVVLEIGFGMGTATADMAAADPGRDYLAADVHVPGIGNLLRLVVARELTNVRVARGDALDLLRHQIPRDSLDAVHIFFPDPWPKSRHHKRRLVQQAHVPLLRSRLRPGGTLHLATDWPPYAAAALAALTADPELVNPYDGYAPRPRDRPLTKFERRGLRAGREVRDLVLRRRAAG